MLALLIRLSLRHPHSKSLVILYPRGRRAQDLRGIWLKRTDGCTESAHVRGTRAMTNDADPNASNAAVAVNLVAVLAGNSLSLLLLVLLSLL